MRKYALCIIFLVFAATTAHAAPPVAPTPAESKALVRGLDTPIVDLMRDPASKAVLDRHLPKLAEHPHYFMIQDMSLRELAKQAHGGNLTDEVLAKLETELHAADAAAK